MLFFLEKKDNETNESILEINSQILEAQGLTNPDFLGILRSIQFYRPRLLEEVFNRMLITTLVAFIAANSSEDTDEAKEFIETMSLYSQMTDEEKDILDNFDNLSEQDKIDLSWRYEAAYVLAWALNLVEDMPFPEDTIDVETFLDVVMQKAVVIKHMSSYSELELRLPEEIIQQADLNWRYLWNCRESRIEGGDLPSNLDESVVFERQRGFNWLIGQGTPMGIYEDWDNIDTST
jgi:Domain of unknown function (DUF4272)